MTDIRFAEEDGVLVPLSVGLAGDLAMNDEVLFCSGVLTFKF